MAYLYIVTDNSTKAKRLIEASSPANAVAFVAKESFTTTRVTAEVADLINLPIEKVTGEDKAIAEVELAPDPVAASKGKAPVTAE